MHDDVSPLWADFLGSVGKDSTEVTNGPVRVGHGINDVLPLPVTTVGVGVELSVASRCRDRLRDERGVDALHEYDGRLILGVRVLRVDVILGPAGGGYSDVWHPASPHTTDEVVAWGKLVDHVVEAAITTGDTEWFEQRVDLRGVAEVFLNLTVITDDLVGGFRSAYKCENWTTIFTPDDWVHSGSVTAEFHIDVVQDSLSQPRGRSDQRERGSVPGEVLLGDDLVLSNPDIFVAETLLPSPLGVLGEDAKDVPQLLLPLHGEAEVVDADLWRLNRSLLEVIRAQGLREVHNLGGRHTV